MRVAVVGATGNAGTAVLEALHNTPEVDSILGIARRMPNDAIAPYAGCDWTSIDIAAASSAEQAESQLAEAFQGVDAVIHLAWLIQPNTERELLRRVNVEGTRRVANAAAAAGVSHLVVASSVGAYSPDDGDAPRDENWPTEGIESSHYSVDKAAQEKVLDEFSEAHPEVTVTRLRPALTFQAAAASSIQRYFLSKAIPVQALKYGKLPALPLPKGITVQAVHAADLGRAYAAAVVKKAPGAFNICADDILGPQELADLIAHGRVVQLPPQVVRAAVAAAYKTGTIAADPGWLDMGMEAPNMDNSRAKSELDWTPRHTAAEAFLELIDGFIEGSGAGSVPMRPRDPDQAIAPGVDEPAEHGADSREGSPDDAAAPLPEGISEDLLNLYISDHLTGATAGEERLYRMAQDFVDTPVFAKLSEVAEEIRAERTLLKNIIHDLGLKQKPYRQAVSWVGERVGRLKLNGKILERSPMTMVLEAELMRSAIMGKIGGWQTLREHATELNLDPEVFQELEDSAWQQISALDDVHAYARRHAFREGHDLFDPHEDEDVQDESKEDN